jgi:gas vesicle protein
MAQDNSSRIVWFLAGAAIGAAIALLYAPQSGEETREYLGKRARQGRDKLAGAGQDLADKGRDLFDKGRRVAGEAAELFERGRRIVEGV